MMKKGLIAIIGLSLIMGILMPRIAEASDFTVHDHTLVMEAIMVHHSEIEELLPENPTTADVLNAALQVPAIDEYVKNRINMVLEFLPELEQRETQLPEETWAAVEEIKGVLEECESISEMIQTLQDMIDSHKYDEYVLPIALECGIQILQDGQGTIYNPEWPPYGDFGPPHIMIHWAVGMGVADVIGGVIGGLEDRDGNGKLDWDWGDAGKGAVGMSVGFLLGKFF